MAANMTLMRTASWLLAVGAVLLLLGSLAHALLGWPPIRDALERAGVADDLIGGLAVGWYFGSVAMAAFGVILVLCWRQARARTSGWQGTAACLSLAYVTFGISAFFMRSFNLFFLVAFVLPGFIIGSAAVFGWRKP